jgi:hypothetical protein
MSQTHEFLASGRFQSGAPPSPPNFRNSLSESDLRGQGRFGCRIATYVFAFLPVNPWSARRTMLVSSFAQTNATWER